MRVGSLFSGIGAWEVALRELGISYTLEFFCEKDPYACKSYCAIHGTSASKNLGDITQVNDYQVKHLPEIDMLVYSFPCQSFSISGKHLGFNDVRGILFFDALRIIKAKRPKYALMENVKGLTMKQFAREFETMLQCLEDLGYKNHYKVLNSKDFGIPQHRERVFVISTLDHNRDFKFPEPTYNGLVLKDYLESSVDAKYYLSQNKINRLISNLEIKEVMATLPNSDNYTVLSTTKKPTTKSTCRKSWVYDIDKNISGLLATDYKEPKQIKIDSNYRKLTPKEYFRLQGFRDSDFQKCVDVGISNTQLYKQAGNSITIDVLIAIYQELFKGGIS